MKYLLLLLNLIISTKICVSQPNLVSSKDDWRKVLEISKLEHKPILIDFFTSWCAPCKLMDRDVFSKDSVKLFLNNNFVAVKVNAEGNLGKELKRKFNVDAYPTYVYIDNELIPIHVIVGAKKANTFINESNKAIRLLIENKPLSYFESLYKSRICSPEITRQYLHKLIMANKDSLVQPIMVSYLSSLSEDKLIHYDNLELLSIYVRDCRNPYFYLIEKMYFDTITNDNVKRKVIHSYISSVNYCLNQAIAKKDSNLFNEVITIQRRDKNALNIETPIMNARLKFYENIDSTGTTYNYWIRYYMDSLQSITTTALEINASDAFKKIFKNKSTTLQDYEKFVKQWVEGDVRSIAGDLNYFSKVFYDSDFERLKIAFLWSKRSCELLPTAEHLNTFAFFLYKLNKIEEAIHQQEKSIEAAIRAKQDKSPYEDQLTKIKAGKL